ncbi:MAG: cytochrome b N-terminal domain-containing protein [bacterium]
MATTLHPAAQPTPLQETYIRAFWRFILWFEDKVNRAFNNRLNPFYYHGALPNFFLFTLFATGILLMFHYVPVRPRAYMEIQFLTRQVPFGLWMRGVHRYAADGMMICVLVHMFRVWFTDRYRGARILPWLTGVALLWLLYIVGITGYMLIWDGRAQIVTKMTMKMFEWWPMLVGITIGSSKEITDYTLSRFFSYHIGLALGIFFFLVLHYIRLYKPKTATPMPLWMLFLGLTFFIAGAVPVTNDIETKPIFPGTGDMVAGDFSRDSGKLLEGADTNIDARVADAGKNLGSGNQDFTVDWLYMWPYGLYYAVGPTAFWLFSGFIVVLLFVPYFVKTQRPFAYVIEEACVGCQLCYLDCPFNAIEMIEKPSLKKGRKPKLLAIVYEARCTSCGVCVGSCAYEAIEIPRVRSQEIEAAVASLCS